MPEDEEKPVGAVAGSEGETRPGEARRDDVPPTRALRIPRLIARSVIAYQHAAMLIALVILSIAFAILSPHYVSSGNILNIGRQIAIVSIVAFGATAVIIAGEIDLSVGSVMGLTSVAVGIVLHGTPLTSQGPSTSLFLALGIGLLVGLGIGFFNGLVTVYGRIPSFIVTLGTLSIARGLALSYGTGVPDPITSRPYLATFGDGSVFGIPVLILYTVLVLGVMTFVLRSTLFGIQVYATGGNAEASRLAGVPVRRVRVAVLAIGGLLAGFAGILGTARVQTALPQLGVGIELDAIAAAVLGGTRFSGGRGTVVGTLLGAILIGVINNGLTLLGVGSTFQSVIKGAVIILAVLLDRFRPR